MSTTGDPWTNCMTRLAEEQSPLDVARRDLARRAQALDESGPWQERLILSHLASVADMVCRIGDHDHSSHYRADKSGPLVRSALAVETECMRAYAGTDGDDQADFELFRAAEVLEKVADAVRLTMWVTARRANGSGAELYASHARKIRDAEHAFHRWAESVCAGSVPDPVDE